MVKELFEIKDTNNKAVIYKTFDKTNPYMVELNISFTDYESARAFLGVSGFPSFKRIIKEDED